MFFKSSTKTASRDGEYFYIPFVERPRNLKELGEKGPLWTFLTHVNVYRLFYASAEAVPRDENGVAICLKVPLNSEQISQLELLNQDKASPVYRGALAFQPEAIDSCILLRNTEIIEYKRAVIEDDNTLHAGIN